MLNVEEEKVFCIIQRNVIKSSEAKLRMRINEVCVKSIKNKMYWIVK